MQTLKNFLQEFTIFKSEAGSEDGQTGEDTMDFDFTSQEDGGTDVTIGGEGDESGECICKCRCCDHGKDQEEGSVDDNIEVIEPEEGEDEFDIDAEEESDDDSDPTKDYNLF